jgi:hypothetical protein
LESSGDSIATLEGTLGFLTIGGVQRVGFSPLPEAKWLGLLGWQIRTAKRVLNLIV